jgi:hypothetical protein
VGPETDGEKIVFADGKGNGAGERLRDGRVHRLRNKTSRKFNLEEIRNGEERRIRW